MFNCRVTSDFPRIDLTEATTAIKSSAPQNEVLQNVKAPTWAGGQVHILLGIKLNALFPELIHMMPNSIMWISSGNKALYFMPSRM